MFLIISLIISLLEIKNIIKDKKIKLIIFYVTIIALSIIIYIKRNEIESIKVLIEKLEGLLNGKN